MTEKTAAATDDAIYTQARAAQQKAIRQRRRRLRALAKASESGTSVPSVHPVVDSAVAQTLNPTHRSPTQQSGDDAETRAMRYLQAEGLVILQRNLHCRAGEIDLVCRCGDTLVFVEVRHRNTADFGGAAASVNRRKQQRLTRAAHYFLPRLSRQYFHNRPPPCRFDVIAIEPDGLRWIRNAFETE